MSLKQKKHNKWSPKPERAVLETKKFDVSQELELFVLQRSQFKMFFHCDKNILGYNI